MTGQERLEQWELRWERGLSGRLICDLQVQGPPAFASYLAFSFPSWEWSPVMPPRQAPFHWAVYGFCGEGEDGEDTLAALLNAFRGRYLVEAGSYGPLAAVMALFPHGEYLGEFQPTRWGASIMASKGNQTRGAWQSAAVTDEEWWSELGSFLSVQPWAATVRGVAAIPPVERPPGYPASSPSLVQRMAERARTRYGLKEVTLVLDLDTPQKHVAEPRQRWLNLEQKFTVPEDLPEDLQSNTILVLDDVLSTGATLRQAGYALKRAGAACVVALALTRAYPHHSRGVSDHAKRP